MELAYDGFHKIALEEVEMKGRTRKYEKLIMKNAAAVIAVDSIGNLCLVEQNRPMSGLDDTSLEIPAGMIDNEETPADAALREFFEETELSQSDIVGIDFYLNYRMVISASDATCSLFVVRVKGDKTGTIHFPKDGQVIATHWLSVDELRFLLKKNLLSDPKTIIAAQHVINGMPTIR